VSQAPAKKKEVKVHVLRCGCGDCRALQPFEETDEGLLLGNMMEVAERDGDRAYFPCRTCGGRILVEEVVHEGKRRTRVCGFEAA
jgi:hypothetical protein